MNIQLELPPELEAQLTAEATQRNIPLEEYALSILADRCRNAFPTNGAAVVDYWKKAGLIGTRTDISDPSEHARRIRERAQTRENS